MEPIAVSELEDSLEKELVRCGVSALELALRKARELVSLLTLFVSADGYSNE